MDERIKALAEQVNKVKEMAASYSNVLSVTVRYHARFDNMVAEIHVADPLPEMRKGTLFGHDLLKRSVDVDGVDVFCLVDKEEENGL